MSSDAPDEDRDADGMPAADELEEPSTEKDPGEEPESGSGDQPQADHEAVGIGIVGRPQVDQDAGE